MCTLVSTGDRVTTLSEFTRSFLLSANKLVMGDLYKADFRCVGCRLTNRLTNRMIKAEYVCVVILHQNVDVTRNMIFCAFWGTDGSKR